MPGFVHLNVHSCFSMMRGIPWPDELCARALEAGMERIALTDTDGLYGLIWFLQEAQAQGIKPIVGAEVTDPGSKKRAVVLVRKREGYPALCEMLSRRHLDKDFSLGRTLRDADGALTILTDDTELLTGLRGRPNVYCEIRQPTDSNRLHQWAKANGYLSALTSNVHFLDPAQHKLHRLLRAIATNSAESAVPAGEIVPASSWFKTEARLREEFPHIAGGIECAAEIAAECETDWTAWKAIYPVFQSGSGMNSHDLLRKKCEAGIGRRYGCETPEVRARLEHELDIICRKQFEDIFLIVADVVSRTSLTCGRGSAAASLVSYLLFITDVDPIRHNLFFERFLNEKREDPPDIDVDFAWDERDDILKYIFEKYGDGYAAMVSNHVSLKAAAALREVAKIYGIPDQEITRVTTKLRGLLYATRVPFQELIHKHPMFKDVELREPWPEIIESAMTLAGRPRHLSVHCGGVVLAPEGIRRRAPVQLTPKGLPVIHWEKDQAEDAGLVKIDILGNRSLAVIRDALAAVREHTGRDITYATLQPIDDPETQGLIARGDTMGVFYVESPAMRLLQQKTQKGDFEHLVVASSIIRPAANIYITEYVRRLRGGKWAPLHPLLADNLAETYGIMCYQEDVSKAAIALADFDAGEADGLRKILSKKTPRRLQEYKDKFYAGASAKGVTRKTIDAVWDMIMSFSEYSFCKPHSASYALVSFKSAWLKVHFPAEFMAAVITNQGGYYATFAYVSEAKRMGIKVLPPDVNTSERAYTGRGREMRIGLMQIKGLTDAGIEAVTYWRKLRPYKDLNDFLARVDIDAADARLLVKAGCFDAISQGMTRPDMMWRVHQWAAGKSRSSGRTLSLFDKAPEDVPIQAGTEEYSTRTMLRHELETLGFLASRHPLTLFREPLSKIAWVPAKDLKKYVGRRISTVGWYVTGKVVTTKDNDPMEFVSFEDTTAIYETVFFPEAYARFCHIMTYVRPYILTGKVDEEYDAVTMQVDSLKML